MNAETTAKFNKLLRGDKSRRELREALWDFIMEIESDAYTRGYCRATEFRAPLLKKCRLMLYAWRGARKNMGLVDNHTELNALLDELDIVAETIL